MKLTRARSAEPACAAQGLGTRPPRQSQNSATVNIGNFRREKIRHT